MSDHRGAAMLLPALPAARELLADRGYDSNRFRAALAKQGINPCIPSTKGRNVALPYDKTLYCQRHRELLAGYGRPKLRNVGCERDREA